MGKPKDQIGLKEYVTIAIFLIGIKSTDDIPSILFDSLKSAGWIAPVISGLIAIIPLFLLLDIAQKNSDKYPIDIFCHAFGKYIGLFIVFLLWLVGFIYIVLDTAIYSDIISTMYFINTPTIVLYAILLAVSAFAAKKGLEQIGTVTWVVFPYLQATLLISIILMISQGNFDFIFPILGAGKEELIKQSAVTVSIYVDFLYLFFLFPYIKSSKDYKNGTWIAFIIIIFNITISIIGYVMLFDYHSVLFLNYPYHEAIRTVTFGFLTNIETIIFPFWLIAADIKFAIYLYLNVFIFSQLFKIKHFEFIIPAFATLILFLGLMPDSPTFTIAHMTKWMGYIFSPIFFFLPIVLWVLVKLKGDL